MNDSQKNTRQFLDFERPIADILARIEELETMQKEGETIPEKDIDAEIERLQIKEARVSRLLFRSLSPHQTVQVARHPDRPHASDYINNLITDFVPLAGDRAFGDDAAVIAGVGILKSTQQKVAILGIDKGKTTKTRMARNFGMPKPEGYRKGQRIMDMAEKFNLPLICFVDTPGAYPGVEAEARGQGEAIASSIERLLCLDTPVVSIITGEGGSGGALAFSVADKVLMLENSIYSVISPEGCASILWKEANKDTIEKASDALKLTAKDLDKLKVIDGIIKEPVGGAHRDTPLTLERVEEAITSALAEILPTKERLKSRRDKFLQMGA